MSARRSASILVAALLVCTPVASGGLALAATFPEETPFSQSAFDAAQKAGDPILVHITASWCTTCAAQKPILDKLLGERKFKPLKTFNVNFDTQKALVREFGARVQSTLIVFHGAKEVGRSSGETQPAAIEGLLAKAV